jgi:hypothetical protein
LLIKFHSSVRPTLSSFSVAPITADVARFEDRIEVSGDAERRRIDWRMSDRWNNLLGIRSGLGTFQPRRGSG